MIRRHQIVSHDYVTPESRLDDLYRGIRRLVLHCGFDRSEIESPLLKRLTPQRGLFGGIVESDLRQRLKDAQLDADAISYLIRTAETELEFARWRTS